jgi:hypothetical protein
VLPSGLVRIRQFGFLANRVRKQKLELCRALLAAPTLSPIIDSDDKLRPTECHSGHFLMPSTDLILAPFDGPGQAPARFAVFSSRPPLRTWCSSRLMPPTAHGLPSPGQQHHSILR